VVEQIAVDYSGYKYFGSKALIIMAKNYFMLGDSFQATEILQSVIDNFATFEDVLTEAQSELERIKSEEAKLHSSDFNCWGFCLLSVCFAAGPLCISALNHDYPSFRIRISLRRSSHSRNHSHLTSTRSGSNY
jgi:hypothetical protein